MIRLRQLRLSRSGRMLLDGASADIALGECVALVGRNGCGKSTLLRALLDEVPLDGGSIEMPPMQIAFLEQTPPSGSVSALEFTLAGDARTAAVLARLAESEARGDHDAAARAHIELDDIGGYDATARAARVLSGLGFDEAQMRMPVDALSGGWRMRLNLARVMTSPAELLLLDEPTNHLDLDAVLWVEQWLRAFEGTVLLVSHDREFVDAVADRVLHFDHGLLRTYTGGYSDFEVQRAATAAQAERQADAQARRIAELERFVERFRAKATKARQAQSRVKALQRMARIVRPAAEAQTEFRFFDAGPGPDPLIVVEDAVLGYPEHRVLAGVDLAIPRGARLGVLGRNGQGKSTLVRTLAGALVPLAGSVRRSSALRVGYLAQQATEELDPHASPLRLLARLAPETAEQALRDYLAAYGFRGEQAMLPCGPFSGGEKARLALALIAWSRPHLLILDEPTNHLDAQARDALAEALAAFDGALVLVAHDRHLLRATVDAFVIVHDGRVEPFDDDLEGYRQWLLAHRPQVARPTRDAAPQPPAGASPAGNANRPVASAEAAGSEASRTDSSRGARREARAQAARERELLARQRKPLEERMKRLERELEPLQAKLQALDALLSDPEAATRSTDMGATARERGEVAARIGALEEQWLELAEAIEQLAGS